MIRRRKLPRSPLAEEQRMADELLRFVVDTPEREWARKRERELRRKAYREAVLAGRVEP